jgi:hypothetical protein
MEIASRENMERRKKEVHQTPAAMTMGMVTTSMTAATKSARATTIWS